MAPRATISDEDIKKLKELQSVWQAGEEVKAKAKAEAEAAATRAKAEAVDASLNPQFLFNSAVDQSQAGRTSISSNTAQSSAKGLSRQIGNSARTTASYPRQFNPAAHGFGLAAANYSRNILSDTVRYPLISHQGPFIPPTFRGPFVDQSQRFKLPASNLFTFSPPDQSGSTNSKNPFEAPGSSQPVGFAQAQAPAFGSTSHNPVVISDSEDEAQIYPKKKQKQKHDMAGKKSAKALEQEGLGRTNNGFAQHTWPEVATINQKNYYTEYMKRDDQILPIRLQEESKREKMIQSAKDRDRALARTGDTEVPYPTNGDGDAEAEGAETDNVLDGSKVIVIHPGSQNLRIGFANDALPKTVPMCLAYKWADTESKEYEARPKRQKLDTSPDQQFGDDFSRKFAKMSADLKADMRANKRKVLPNSKELVVNYNKRTEPEKIPEHNDPARIEWTDIAGEDESSSPWVAGVKAQRIPDDSNPSYTLAWPIQNGQFNEKYQYCTESMIFDDFEAILASALRDELGLKGSLQWQEYNAVFIVPDLYDKKYIEYLLDVSFKEFEFKQVTFIQESFAASFGAAYTRVCVVDIGAQKTSIACVDDGMVIEESRINLKYGGRDVTETFIKMLLHDGFPYQEINLMRRYDFLLAEELKIKFCTMNQADISVQLYNFHLRAPNEATRKYQFKTYDEPLLALMGFFDPSIFDHSDKLKGRRTLVKRSYNPYDPDQPDDPISAAQLQILASIKPSLAPFNGPAVNGNGNADMSTPQKEKPNPFNHISRMDSQANGDSRATSAAGSPVPEGASTPSLGVPISTTNNGSPAPNGTVHVGNDSHNSGTPVPAGTLVDHLSRTAEDLAIERDSVLPVSPLETAIIASITHAAKGDEKKARDLFGGIMAIGGAVKTPGLVTVLEEKLRAKRPDLGEKILVGIAPREMDGQILTWKGGSVYARMTTHDSWVGKLEWERLGFRCLHHKLIWAI